MKVRLNALLAAVLLFSQAWASDWPCYRGANSDGIVHEPDLLTEWPADGLKVLWNLPLLDEKDNSHCGPTVVDGKVYLAAKSGENDIIYCLKAADGSQLWKYEYEAPVHDEVYGTGVRASPTVYKEFVYTLSCFGLLFCFEKDTGKVVWRRDLVKEFGGKPPSFGMSAAPTIVDGMLICEPGGPGSSIAALDPLTGKEIWKAGDDEASYAAPSIVTLGGVRQLLTFLSPGLVSVDPKTGKEFWRYDYLDERRKNIPAPIVVGDVVYVSNNTLGFTAIKVALENGKWQVAKLWSARREKMHYSSPILGDGCLYYHNSKREIKCIALADGSVRWTASNMGTQYGGLLRLNEKHILATLDSGEIVILEVSPQSFKETGRFKPLGKAFVQPAVADGKLFVRDHANVICFQLSNVKSAASIPVASAVKGANDPAVEISVADENAPKKGSVAARAAHSYWEIHFRQYFVGWLVAATLAMLGVFVASKENLFPSTATSGFVSLGVVSAMWISGMTDPEQYKYVHSNGFLTLMPILFGAFAAAIGLIGYRYKFKVAWALILLSGLGIFALSRSQLAIVDPYFVLASSNIGDTRSQVGDFTTIFLITAAVIGVAYWDGLRNAMAKLQPVKGTGFAIFSLALGVTLGMCVRSTGTLFTVSCLVLPALSARCLTSLGWKSLAIAVSIALCAVTAGFSIAYACHLPLSTLTAAFMTSALAAGAVVSRLKQPVTA